jgi:hypothetical protein
LNHLGVRRVFWAGRLCFVPDRATKQNHHRMKPFSAFGRPRRKTLETPGLYQDAR